MDAELIWDLDSFIERLDALRKKGTVFGIYKNILHQEEVQALRQLTHEKKESLLEPESDESSYYDKVKICKMLLLDIKNRGHYFNKIESILPSISTLTIEDIKKIGFKEGTD